MTEGNWELPEAGDGQRRKMVSDLMALMNELGGEYEDGRVSARRDGGELILAPEESLVEELETSKLHGDELMLPIWAKVPPEEVL